MFQKSPTRRRTPQGLGQEKRAQEGAGREERGVREGLGWVWPQMQVWTGEMNRIVIVSHRKKRKGSQRGEMGLD